MRTIRWWDKRTHRGKGMGWKQSVWQREWLVLQEKRGWRRVLEQGAVGGPTEGSGEGEVPGQIQGRSGRLQGQGEREDEWGKQWWLKRVWGRGERGQRRWG